MSSLIITKETGNYFRFELDGGEAIRNDQNRLLTVGDYCHFKTGNGANIIQKQNILYSEVTLIASGSFTFLSVTALWNKLIEVGFFDGLGGTGGGSVVDRFDELLDTFDYFGRDGQLLYVNESELKLDTATFNLFTDAYKNKLDGIETGAQTYATPDFNITDPSIRGYIANKPSPTLNFVTSLDFPKLLEPQQDFELPEGKIALYAFVNQAPYFLSTANNTGDFNTFTQSLTTVSFTNTLETGEYLVIFYQ